VPSRFLRPFQRFIGTEVSGGILLLAATVVALLWANSPWGHSYTELWETSLALSFGRLHFSLPLVEWIDEGLMVLFFLLVGLEIKRELLLGELSSAKRAMLPAVGALAGMVVPALLYLAVNAGGAGARGWGIPMATDIAFAVGVLALIGPRVPGALGVFVTALAIVDDIGAILVIALFYSAHVALAPLAAAAVLVALLVVANRLGVLRLWVYLGLGLLLWIALLRSGVHATIAGVVLALTLPATSRRSIPHFLAESRSMLDSFEAAGHEEEPLLCNQDRQVLVEALEDEARGMRTPLGRLEDILRPWVAYGVIPLFALANAGVDLAPGWIGDLTEPVALGILLGLVVGKQVGIFSAAWMSTRLRLGSLGSGVHTGHLYGAAWLGGIGFTVSLFIAGLAFGRTPQLNVAKEAILVASTISGLGGWVVLWLVDRLWVGKVSEEA
jgi:Na+:H+ antiporter, NhaA family